MKRIIGLAVIVVGMTVLALGTAGTARASATFNLNTTTGFISRGDVIAAGGKNALVADPYVVYRASQPFTETCTWPDGTAMQVSGEFYLFLLFQAQTRYAPGSSTITGYTFSSPIDGFTNEDPRDLCWNGSPLPDDGSAVIQVTGPLVRTLTFYATGVAEVVLPFHA